MRDEQNKTIEIDLLLEAMWRKYGYDFRNYSRASIERRVFHRLSLSKLDNVLELTHRLLEDRSLFEMFLEDLSIHVTEMFRDPGFFLAFRNTVVPYLKTHPHLRIWVPGCATGEEVYSIAIILKEEGLYQRSQIYATDINETVLQKAKEGIYSLDLVKKYTSNYQKAGGTDSFSTYYTAHYDSVVLDSSLKSNIVFAAHNLATDGVFNEMQLISCRNVLIYFNKELKNRVFRLFFDSLCHSGILCLGTKESLRFSENYDDFEDYVKDEKIHRKK
ncbi:MAG: protein-glutamate O-methyltransferase CheR [Proteobacteria bacterium]|nr:protein-glutamate O-methyltransferase CheR [Pseudomonadota bacterium]